MLPTQAGRKLKLHLHPAAPRHRSTQLVVQPCASQARRSGTWTLLSCRLSAEVQLESAREQLGAAESGRDSIAQRRDELASKLEQRIAELQQSQDATQALEGRHAGAQVRHTAPDCVGDAGMRPAAAAKWSGCSAL